MAVQKRGKLVNIFGFISWGDFGPTTLYRRPDRRVVFFAKTWPEKPASPLQQVQRTRFADAAKAWRALTPAKRAQWKQAAHRASLCMTGYNLFLFASIAPDPNCVVTIARQTGTTLEMT